MGGQHGTIVLVSDGIDTCAPPPVCEVAKELHEQGIDLVINTIGFNVDEEARKELSCIADAAGGEYLDADDADSLASMIKKAAGRAADIYQSDVEHIEGSKDISQPTELPRWESGEDFIFRAELDAPPNAGKESRTDFHAESWSIPVKPGERYVATMYKTLEGAVGTPNDLFLKTFFGDGREPPTGTHGGDEGADDCTADWDSADTGSVSEALPNTSAYTYEIGSKNCQGDLVLTAMRAGQYKADEPIDVEILLHRVDPVSNIDELVSGLSSELDGELHANANGAEQMAPGNWFDNATELCSGQAIETDIVQGEAHVYKVPMKEGQQLAAAIRAGEVSDEKALQYSGLDVSILNPVREKAGEHEFLIWPNEGDEGSASAASPTAFTNRFSSDSAPSYGNANWLEGDYYIVVTLGAGKGDDLGESGDNLTDKHATMKYYLTSKVLGDPIQGPKYEPVRDKTEESRPLDGIKTDAKEQGRGADDKSGKTMRGLLYVLGRRALSS